MLAEQRAEQEDAPPAGRGRAARDGRAPSAGKGEAAARGRSALGVALVIGAALVFLWLNDALRAGARRDAGGRSSSSSPPALILAPWWLRLVRGLAAERAERIRSQERAEMAAHLHDSRAADARAGAAAAPTTRARSRRWPAARSASCARG